jgi:hypothetical protein
MNRPPRSVRRTIDGVIARLDLIYSPDDGGWYLERWDTNATSIVYATADDALAANPIEWD